MTDDNRTFSRINTRLRAYMRKLKTADTALPLFHSAHPTSPHPSSKQLREANVPVILQQYLESLNEKLDTLINLVTRDLLREDFPLKTEVIQLSGAGLQCTTPDNQPLKVGDMVEVVIFLSQSPLNIASAICTIQRREERNEPVLVLEFTKIRESEREMIVQFVFSEQREQIRESKHGD